MTVKKLSHKKRQYIFSGLQCVISQKMELFVTPAGPEVLKSLKLCFNFSGYGAMNEMGI
jgi:hypothetical protein